MKTFRLLSVLCFVAVWLWPTNALQAQRRLQIPHYALNTGIGLLPTFLKDNPKSELLPVFVEARYRPSASYSLGLLVGHSVSTATLCHQNDMEKVRNSFTMVSVRGTRHFIMNEKAELYLGLGLGFAMNDISYPDLEEGKELNPFFPVAKVRNSLVFSPYFGASYKVTGPVFAFAELGTGLSLIKLGVSVQL